MTEQTVKRLSLAEALEDVATKAEADQSVFLDKATWGQISTKKTSYQRPAKPKIWRRLYRA